MTQANKTEALPLTDLQFLLRDAFLSGRGLKGDDFLSDEDRAAWAAYVPEPNYIFERVTAALAKAAAQGE